jgi:hypothetical protein
MCHAKSHIPPIRLMVMPVTMRQIVQGIETASTAVTTSERLCIGNAVGMVCACDIKANLVLQMEMDNGVWIYRVDE